MNCNIYSVDAKLLLFFSDIHIGLRSDNLGRLSICRNTIDNIIKVIEKLGIKHIIFGGDLFHSRTTLNINTINVAIELIEQLSKYAEIFVIVGNHDIHYKNIREINSIKIFNNAENVHIISEVSEIHFKNNHKMLLVPWAEDLANIEDESFDSMCGHFEFSSKYLISSYIEDHSKEYSNENILSDLIKNDIDQYMSDPSQIYNENVSDISVNTKSNKSSSYIGSFVNKCKKGGTIFSGHIHERKEIVVKERNFIFIGSPFEQNFGHIDLTFGFYIYDTNKNKYKFIENKGMPKHKEIKLSEAINDNFDFSICNNNYILPVVDVEVSYDQLSNVINKINDNKPLEVFPPDYKVVIKTDNNEVITENSNACQNVRKNKLAYVIDYITSINNDDLNNLNLKRDRLYKISSDAFNLAASKIEILDNDVE